MIRAVQRLLIEMGEAACYFIAMAWNAVQAGRGVDLVSDFFACVREDWIHYSESDPNDPKNCYINDAGAVFGYLMGEPGQWECVHEGPDYELQPGEFGCARYERVKTGAVLSHFIGFSASESYDPMGLSLTVAQGKRVSTRIFRKKGKE